MPIATSGFDPYIASGLGTHGTELIGTQVFISARTFSSDWATPFHVCSDVERKRGTEAAILDQAGSACCRFALRTSSAHGADASHAAASRNGAPFTSPRKVARMRLQISKTCRASAA